METGTQGQGDGPPGPGVALRLLGPMTLSRAGMAVALPPSRKVRALLAYLALAARGTTRSHLCELLWDLPGDPRGELRWCLSKLRAVLDEADRPRVIASGDSVALDLADGDIDARTVIHMLQRGVATLAVTELEALAALLQRGELLEGLEVPRSPAFSGWLAGERRRLRAAHAAVLEHWARSLPVGSDMAIEALERWLALAPFDRRAHECLLDALAARGRLREAEEHLAAAGRRFEAEGQDWGPLAHAWRAARSRHAIAATPGVVMTAPAAPPEPALAPTRRASIAVMPFADRTPGGALRGGLGDGLARDVTLRLARLRSVFVIAEGTMATLAERHVDSEDAGRRLDVDYIASGWLRRGPDGHLVVSVQLTQTRSGQVLWAEEFSAGRDDTFLVLEEIGNRIVTAIANQIEAAERNRAILKNPNCLDAWEAHHRGLWHMFRFDREDNEQARQFFRTAVRLDPTFSRPHAGLSFTHFQDAFLGWRERASAIQQAYAAAAEGVMADAHDPASHWALGRALWLMDREDEAVRELQSAIDLSPNFALGHYTLGFVQAQSGDAESAIAEVDQARALSPMDPLLFGMLASRALALLRLGRCEEAADWALRSAARPNAHVHIRAIAVFCLAMAGRTEEAKALAAAIRRTQPRYGLADFGQAFKFGPELQGLLRQAASLVP
ncbi:MAG TPA: transcriptional regulator [Ramlibacter sp.]|uniref:transcriptional regulator n=1 Tax=Ramlibacter sp. TaxID=1917967 RepID=UPI002D8094E8|nr:transcriptional regulator [Ramlibacter sp.]HET8745564.1 transcriptional regulator [Ramlibacter sp.]